MNDKMTRVASMPQLALQANTGNDENRGPIVRSRSSADFACDIEADHVRDHRGYKKVLVTGGAGFIGSHVTEALLQRGDDVVIVDDMNDYYDVHIKESNIKYLQSLASSNETNRLVFYKGDICDEDFMMRIFQEEKPEWICHLAARAGVRPSIQDPFIYIQTNIRGTTYLLELASKFNVKNFVFASSSR
jgi:UDP-glucuronate 4-epimerase